ncbi:HYR domain-containing protein, partial [Oceanihabitans sp.]|nr:HYR domain-containing protein [Oceanihabitans sp.]
MKRFYFQVTLALLFLITLNSYAQNLANTVVSSRVDRVESSDNNCQDGIFSGDEEYTAFLRMQLTSGTYSSTCIQRNNGSGLEVYGLGVLISANRLNSTQSATFVLDAWEDDVSPRCTYNSGDDCHAVFPRTVNYRTDFPAPGGANNLITNYFGVSNSHRARVRYDWHYTSQGTTALAPQACETYERTLSGGTIGAIALNLQEGKEYNFETIQGGDTNLRLYNANGYYIMSQNDNGGSGSLSKITYTAGYTGTYFIEVSNASRNPLSANTVIEIEEIDTTPPDNTIGFELLPESTIISGTDQSLLASWVPANLQYEANLLFTKTVDGSTASTFHSLCDGIPNTLFVARTTDGRIFGGYNEGVWNGSQSGYIHNLTNNFLFSVTNQTKHNPGGLVGSSGNNTIYNRADYGPTFGGGHDLVIYNNLTNGYSNLGHSYECVNGTYGSTDCRDNLAGSYNGWQIEEIEVWELSSTGNALGNGIVITDVEAQCEVISIDAPIAPDNCAGEITGTTNTAFPITTQGLTEVTWTFDDGNGNTSSIIQNVTIEDTENPIAICQNITLTLDENGQATLTAEQVDDGSSDNCGPVTLSIDRTSFSCDDAGGNSTAITPTFIGTQTQQTQSHGGGFNPNTNEFWYPQWTGQTVYRYDINHNFLGTFNSGQQQMMQLWMDTDSDTDYYTANWNYNTITKRSGSTTVWTYNLGGTAAAVTTDDDHVYAIAWGSNQIRVLDKTNGTFIRTITLPGTTLSYGSLVYANGNLYIGGRTNNWGSIPNIFRAIHTIDATDGTYISSTSTTVDVNNMAFDGETMWISNNSNTIYGYQIAEGSVDVVLTVTDANNNVSTCTASVSVIDTSAPTIACPANITQNVDAGVCGATVTYTVTTADNCTTTIEQTEGLASGEIFPVGLTTNTFIVTDAAGNTVTCSFDVTIIDNEDPTITCPTNMTVNNDEGQCGAVVNYEVTGMDNCSGIGASALPDVLDALNTNFATITDIIPNRYIFNYDGGVNGNQIGDGGFDMYDGGNRLNTNLGTFIQYSDNTIISNNAFGTGGEYFTRALPGLFVMVADIVAPLTRFNIEGNNGADNSGSVSGSVQTLTKGGTTYRAFIKEVYGTSDPSINHMIIVENNPSASQTFANNTDNDNHVVNGLDSSNRIYYLLYAGRTSSGAYDITDSEHTAIFEAFTDLLGSEAAITQTAGIASGEEFPVGTTTNTFVVTDVSGNTATCSFDVTVVDNEGPVVATDLLPDSTIISGTDQDLITGWLPANLQNEANLLFTKTVDGSSSSAFHNLCDGIPNTLVVVKTTDGFIFGGYNEGVWNGNLNNYTYNLSNNFLFSVNNQTKHEPGGPGSQNSIYSNSNYGPTFGNGHDLYINTNLSGGYTYLGYSYDCIVGTYNSNECRNYLAGSYSSWQIEELEVWELRSTGNQAGDGVPDIFAQCEVTTLETIIANDNCSGDITGVSDANLPITDQGTTVITWTFNDGNGNITTETQNVIIEDNEAPTAICQDVTLQLDENGQATLTAEQVDNGSFDNCSAVTISIDRTNFSCDDIDSGSTAIIPNFVGTQTQPTLSHGGGFNPNTNEFWYPAWSGSGVTRYDTNHNVVGSFNSGQQQMMQLWMDTDSTTDYYTANWYYNTITKRSGSTTVWSTNMGTTAAAVTTDADYVYALLWNSNQIRVLDKTNGAIIRTITLPGTINSFGAMVYANGNLYIGGYAYGWSSINYNYRAIHIIDATDGTYISSTSTTVDVNNMAFDGETMWFSNNSNTIYGYQIADGNVYEGSGNAVVLTVTDAYGNESTCNANITVEDNIDPTITCPGAIAQDTDSGLCTAVVNYSVTSDDNCSGQTIEQTAGIASGQEFPLGITTNTFVVTDAGGNTATCSFDVTVTDNDDPAFTCPTPDASYTADQGLCSTELDFSVTPTDNCDVASTVYSVNGSPISYPYIFPVGTTTVDILVTDVNDNTSECSFDVVITDDEDPAFICPTPDVSYTADQGLCSKELDFSVSPSDNCDMASTVYSVNGSAISYPYAFPVGTTTVDILVTDIHSNTSDCSFDVVVTDDEDPVFTCPTPDVSYTADQGLCSASLDFSVSPNDNCDVASTVYSVEGSAINYPYDFPVGTTTVDILVTDIHTNTSECSFDVTVTDNESPTITCPADISLNATSAAGTVVTYTAPIGLDNCPGATTALISGPVSGSTFPIGVTTITYEVTDASDNTTSCSFTVTVLGLLPEIVCPANITVSNDATACGALVSFEATDDVGIPASTITYSHVSGSEFPVGITTVTATATNAVGSSECTFTITVNDTEDPAFTCPTPDVSYTADPGLCSAALDFSVSPTDNCDVASTVYSVEGSAISYPYAFPVGTTTVDILVTDIHSNTSECSFDVVVTDDENPAFTCPTPDVSYTADPGFCSASLDFSVSPTDNCDVASTVYSVNTTVITYPYAFPVGTTTVDILVTDIHANTSECSFDVVVTDDENPAFTCPTPEVSYTADPGLCSASLNFSVAASDNCPGVSTVYSVEGSVINYPYAFPVGTTTVDILVTDIHTNTSECSFDVVVTDDEDPAFTCPTPDVSYTADPGLCSASLDFTVSPTDNCDVASTVYSVNTTVITYPYAFPVGTTTVGILVTDIHNHTSECSFDVVVTDDEDPAFTCPTPDVSYTADQGLCSASLDFSVSPSDNCDVASTVYSVEGSAISYPYAFPVGTTTVDILVTDIHSNTSDCSFDVIVTDDELPTITCSGDFEVDNDLGDCGAVVTFNITSTDNCPNQSVEQTSGFPSGTLFPVGTTINTFVVTDASGNTATCSFDVTVEDTEAPVVACNEITIVLDGNGNVNLDASLLNDSSTDNCGGP